MLLSSVSIHAPAQGATGFYYKERAIYIVSIHAPAQGATMCIICGSKES